MAKPSSSGRRQGPKHTGGPDEDDGTAVRTSGHLGEPLLLSHLDRCESVLLAGAGGGFDVYAALPIASWLWRRKKTVHLANLSFSALATTRDADLAPALYAIRPDTEGPDDYFPERILARFLASEGLPSTVHAFARSGVAQVHSAYVALCERLSVDAIVLVDGGTDILMFGDEAGLGTPVEDMTSLAAVGQIRLAERHVACLGFGVDAYHGVCHAHFLENVATLEKDGAYHGAFSVPRVTEEGAFFLRAVEHAREAQPDPVSIVNGSIAHAMRGDFGDVQFTRRTSSSELFVNPLMAMYFTFDLMGVCKRNLYLRQLVGSPSPFHTAAIIEGFREDVRPRARKTIPHLPRYLRRMALFDKLERVADQASTLIHETVVLVHLAQETLRMLRPVLEDLPQITAQTRRVLEDLESRGMSPP